MTVAAMEIVLRLVGGFYVFAGIVGMRALVMDHLMDQVLAGIALKPIPANEHRRRWLLGCSTLAIGMGGMALMVLSLWAVPLFLFGAVTQAVYLVWARRAFPPEDDDERKGRRQTTNAALLYGIATFGVCLAAGFGLLRDWRDPWAALIPAAGLLLLALIGRHFLWQGRRQRASEPDADWPELEPAPPLYRVRLEPLWGGDTLLDADTGIGIEYDLYVPAELGGRIYAWAHAFHAGDDHVARELWVQFADAQAETTHRAEGEAIVAALRTIFGDEEVFGPVYPADVRYGPEDA